VEVLVGPPGVVVGPPGVVVGPAGVVVGPAGVFVGVFVGLTAVFVGVRVGGSAVFVSVTAISGAARVGLDKAGAIANPISIIPAANSKSLVIADLIDSFLTIKRRRTPGSESVRRCYNEDVDMAVSCGIGINSNTYSFVQYLLQYVTAILRCVYIRTAYSTRTIAYSTSSKMEEVRIAIR
jgi:hypothetical protein